MPPMTKTEAMKLAADQGVTYEKANGAGWKLGPPAETPVGFAPPDDFAKSVSVKGRSTTRRKGGRRKAEK